MGRGVVGVVGAGGGFGTNSGGFNGTSPPEEVDVEDGADIPVGGKCLCGSRPPWHLVSLAAPTFRLHCRCGRRYAEHEGGLRFRDRVVGALPMLGADRFGTRLVPPRRDR